MVFKCDLSIIIPARNEEFLYLTVEDILENMEGDTEIIVVLDGHWATPPIQQHDRVTVLHLEQPIGQRAATNLGAKIAAGTYLMKVDAHCAFDKGFDRKMLEVIEPDITLVPVMKNLHVFNWVCNQCGNILYQGPTPEECSRCSVNDWERVLVWKPKPSPNSTAYRFNRELEFKYFPELKGRQQGDLVETMSLQGSCFMVHRSRYFLHNLCDESWGSWGGQGAEVALKTWLSGNRVLCYKKTWYAHLFRTQKDFSFPYPNPGKEQRKAKNKLREIFLHDKWEHAIYPLKWLVDRFSPVPDWHDHSDKPETGLSENKKGILYYTHNQLNDRILLPVRARLSEIGLPVVASNLRTNSFGKGWSNPDVFILYHEGKQGYMTMFEQILMGLQHIETDYVFFAEHDVLYHPSHFDFRPPRDDTFYYNQHVYKVHSKYGFGLHYLCSQTSGLCAHRKLLIEHYEKRITYIREHDPGNHKEYMKLIRRIGFEPGTHGRIPELKARSDTWMSEYPNLDIRHNENLTPSRWRRDQFRNQRFTQGWTGLVAEIPGWGTTLGRFDELLLEVENGA